MSTSKSLTYRMVTDSKEWRRFFTSEQAPDFDQKYAEAGFEVDPLKEESLIAFQRKLEAGGTKYYLNATQIRTQALDVPLKVYQRRK